MKTQKYSKVYYQDSGYPIERNMLNLPFEKYKPVRKIGLMRILSHLHYKFKGSNRFLSNSHWEMFKKKNSIWHFFNGVSFGKTPWVVTYETFIPRWQGRAKKIKYKGVEVLADFPCKKLIALSNCTKKFQIQYLQENFPSFTKTISQKIDVIHPPQKQIVKNYKEKDLPKNSFVFTIVGSLFFIKGGREILNVFDRLLKKKVPVELNIISKLKLGGYAAMATSDDVKEAKKIINKYPNHIHYYNELPNNLVMEKLKRSHIGLLPSYAETYGYSVLEAQACGCPVITTNIRALPEINNENCGWVIDVPKDRWSNGILDTEKQRAEYSAILTERLYEIIFDIVSNPDQIFGKAKNSLKRIEQKHDPINTAHQLEHIYDMALMG